jgi:hypothetical protein
MKNHYIWSTIIVFIVLGCKVMNVENSEIATQDHPSHSPSGKYVLEVKHEDHEGILSETFVIRMAATNEVLFAYDEWYNIRHTTVFLWDAADRVWVYSGDIGTYFWERDQDDHHWTQHAYAQSKVNPPQYLIDFRPQFFKNKH